MKYFFILFVSSLVFFSCEKESNPRTNIIGEWDISEYLERLDTIQYTTSFKIEIYKDGTAKYIATLYEDDYAWILNDEGTVIYLIRDHVIDGVNLGHSLPAFKFDIITNERDNQFWREEYFDGFGRLSLAEWTMTRK